MTDILYRGEMQLARWSETSTGGATITMWLPSGEDLEAFKALTARKNGKAGQILAAIIKVVDENEPEAEPVTNAEPEPLKGGPLARLAGQFINNPKFWEWLSSKTIFKPLSASEADYALKYMLKIDSKIALDHDEKAAMHFHRHIRQPFSAWLDQTNGK